MLSRSSMRLGIRIWWVIGSVCGSIPGWLIAFPSDQMAVKNCFIRGSVVRYVQLPTEHVDTQLLEDATRRGASIVRDDLSKR